MKLLAFLAAAFAVCSANFPGLIPGDNSFYKEGDRYIWFPDDEGTPVLVDLFETEDDTDVLRDATRRGERNVYLLYTRDNPSIAQTLVLGDVLSIVNSNYDPNRVTKMIVHGWRNRASSSVNTLIRAALMDEGDYNIIIVDWSHSSSALYTTCVGRVASIGEYVGRFTEFLIELGTNYQNVHMIGHSLGAHIIGNAGRYLNGKVGRLTGLDPAGPLWPGNSNRIVPEDGEYVEIIHTDSGWLGFWDPCGDVDFYPNGGHSQPGCLLSSCHHSRSYELFASTITHGHLIGNECADVKEATSRACTGEKTEVMGTSLLNKLNDGIYRMDTARRYPY